MGGQDNMHQNTLLIESLFSNRLYQKKKKKSFFSFSISQINESQNNYPKSSQFCFSETFRSNLRIPYFIRFLYPGCQLKPFLDKPGNPKDPISRKSLEILCVSGVFEGLSFFPGFGWFGFCLAGSAHGVPFTKSKASCITFAFPANTSN